MRKNLFLILCLSLILTGCGSSCPLSAKKDKAAVAKINNYDITKEEFETEFKESSFGRTDTLESRKEFLNNLISRKLVLQEAQKSGLDRKPGFLKLIQKFWEQSLIKLALDKKTQEIAGSVKISDREVERLFQELVKAGKTDKPYAQVYNELKWQILKAKEAQRMNEWLEILRKNAKIQIEESLLTK